MTDDADNLEGEETISDLDVPEGDADTVMGGGVGYVKVSVTGLPVMKRFDKSSPQ